MSFARSLSTWDLPAEDVVASVLDNQADVLFPGEVDGC